MKTVSSGTNERLVGSKRVRRNVVGFNDDFAVKFRGRNVPKYPPPFPIVASLCDGKKKRPVTTFLPSLFPSL